jgi:hypothetical protein
MPSSLFVVMIFVSFTRLAGVSYSTAPGAIGTSSGYRPSWRRIEADPTRENVPGLEENGFKARRERSTFMPLSK